MVMLKNQFPFLSSFLKILTITVYSWKLSNSRSGLSQNANNAINAIVSDNIDLWEGYYYNTQQTEDACFHYPIFENLPSAIILPGRCNEAIRGVANFDAAAVSDHRIFNIFTILYGNIFLAINTFRTEAKYLQLYNFVALVSLQLPSTYRPYISNTDVSKAPRCFIKILEKNVDLFYYDI